MQCLHSLRHDARTTLQTASIKIGIGHPYRRPLLSCSMATTYNMVVVKPNKPSRDMLVQCDEQYSCDSQARNTSDAPPSPAHVCLPRCAKSQIPAERDPKSSIVSGPALHPGERLLLEFLESLLGSAWSTLWSFVFSLSFFSCVQFASPSFLHSYLKPCFHCVSKVRRCSE